MLCINLYEMDSFLLSDCVSVTVEEAWVLAALIAEDKEVAVIGLVHSQEEVDRGNTE